MCDYVTPVVPNQYAELVVVRVVWLFEVPQYLRLIIKGVPLVAQKDHVD